MTAPPTRKTSACVPLWRKSSLSMSSSRRISALVSGCIVSDPIAEGGVDEEVPAPEGRRRVGQQMEAHALQRGAESRLRKRRDGANPAGYPDRAPLAGLLDHRRDIVGQERPQGCCRRRRDRIAQLGGRPAREEAVELGEPEARRSRAGN